MRILKMSWIFLFVMVIFLVIVSQKPHKQTQTPAPIMEKHKTTENKDLNNIYGRQGDQQENKELNIQEETNQEEKNVNIKDETTQEMTQEEIKDELMNPEKVNEKILSPAHACTKTIENYYARIKNKQDVSDLFDPMVDRNSLLKLHSSLYQNITYSVLDVKDLYCSQYNDEIFMCSYELVAKYKNSKNEEFSTDQNYITLLSSDCKILQTFPER